MDDRLRQQLEQILEQAEVEEKSEIFLKQAIAIGIPPEDGAWLKSMFRLAAMFLELAYGDKKEANRALPWLLFSLGMAYERYYAQKKGYNGGSKKMTAKVHLSKKELNDLIEAGKAAGNDTSQLEALLAEVAPEKLAGSKARPISGRSWS